jgi:hypothetical protein
MPAFCPVYLLITFWMLINQSTMAYEGAVKKLLRAVGGRGASCTDTLGFVDAAVLCRRHVGVLSLSLPLSVSATLSL